MKKNLIKFNIYCVSIMVILLVFIILNIIITPPSINYDTGHVILVDEDQNMVEVKIDDGGKVYVYNLGDYTCDDIKYGDNVKLKLKNRHYEILEVYESDE